MSQPATDMNDRVTRLENEVAQVRYLAVKANQDTANFQAVISGQTGVLNAIGETQREQNETLAGHSRSLIHLSAIEETQREHSKTLADHTRSLTRLNTLEETLREHSLTLADHTTSFTHLNATVDQHSAILNSHSRILDRHTATLDHHSVVLDSHSKILGTLQVGQEHITTLLTRAINLPETDAGESGE